jgi:hypothetical protein
MFVDFIMLSSYVFVYCTLIFTPQYIFLFPHSYPRQCPIYKQIYTHRSLRVLIVLHLQYFTSAISSMFTILVLCNDITCDFNVCFPDD